MLIGLIKSNENKNFYEFMKCPQMVRRKFKKWTCHPNGHPSVRVCMRAPPWKVGLAGLVAKVFAITLLHSLVSVAITAVGPLTIWG